jgi:hypothetical protein
LNPGGCYHPTALAVRVSGLPTDAGRCLDGAFRLVDCGAGVSPCQPVVSLAGRSVRALCVLGACVSTRRDACPRRAHEGVRCCSRAVRTSGARPRQAPGPTAPTRSRPPAREPGAADRGISRPSNPLPRSSTWASTDGAPGAPASAHGHYTQAERAALDLRQREQAATVRAWADAAALAGDLSGPSAQRIPGGVAGLGPGAARKRSHLP